MKIERGPFILKHPILSKALGYLHVIHKDGIKILIDQHSIVDVFPTNIRATLQHVSQLINDLTYCLKININKTYPIK